ncbi:MAG: hypothetical protein WB615_15855 [Candidatus Tumulicola sp.]
MSLDARLSYETLRRNAELLGSVSASFSREARDASEAYRDALTTSTTDAWTRFVEAADALARHTKSVATVVPLDAGERQACAFFEQIAGENADLFPSPTPALV